MIYIGADHRGFNLKEKIIQMLRDCNDEVIDLGFTEYNADDDYPDIAFKLGEKVVLKNGKGILICGSGVGVCAAVNKVKGVRAGLCMLAKQARAGRNDDDMNVLCLNADIVPEDDNREIVKIFLETLFGSEERYIRRINKIKAYESAQR
ncbi:MAG: RpiB/LacA/LacB family sugar-phosphate isomerase [Candidatus Shapirobacteria bacterium]|nr:RpiB/LacA/LacB family sugar-phosphate isomerase [Candidatus Shapirobacteria bacterium]